MNRYLTENAPKACAGNCDKPGRYRVGFEGDWLCFQCAKRRARW